MNQNKSDEFHESCNKIRIWLVDKEYLEGFNAFGTGKEPPYKKDSEEFIRWNRGHSRAAMLEDSMEVTNFGC